MAPSDRGTEGDFPGLSGKRLCRIQNSTGPTGWFFRGLVYEAGCQANWPWALTVSLRHLQYQNHMQILVLKVPRPSCKKSESRMPVRHRAALNLIRLIKYYHLPPRDHIAPGIAWMLKMALRSGQGSQVTPHPLRMPSGAREHLRTGILFFFPSRKKRS